MIYSDFQMFLKCLSRFRHTNAYDLNTYYQVNILF